MSESTDSDRAYGEGDATHQALGGVDAILRLVEVFYEEMDTLPEAAKLQIIGFVGFLEIFSEHSYILEAQVCHHVPPSPHR